MLCKPLPRCFPYGDALYPGTVSRNKSFLRHVTLARVFITAQEMSLSHIVPLIKRNGWVINKSAQEKTRENADERTARKIDKRGSLERGVQQGRFES